MKKMLLMLVIFMASIVSVGCADEPKEIRSASYFVVEYLTENNIDGTQPYFIKTEPHTGYIYFRDELIYDSRVDMIGNRVDDTYTRYNIFDVYVTFRDIEETTKYIVLITSGYTKSYRGIERSKIKEIVIIEESVY